MFYISRIGHLLGTTAMVTFGHYFQIGHLAVTFFVVLFYLADCWINKLKITSFGN